MAILRFFRISVALAIVSVIPVAPACAAHGGGGGGGGGMHGGFSGGGGAVHSSFGGGGAVHSSFGGAGTVHSSYASGGAARTTGYAGSNHVPNSGSSFVHYGNLNGSQNFQSAYHSNGTDGWGHHDWDNSFRGPYWGIGWGAGWAWGWGYPWFPYWGGYPFGWGGYWADYFSPYGPVYATGYPAVAGVYPYADDGQYAANFGNVPGPAIADNRPQLGDDNGEGTVNEGLQYYNEARVAFLQGDYRNALRLAGHSGVESPQNTRVHELTSLALFAAGEYRGAAIEAHAALALGPPSDWSNLYGYYNDAEKYTQQLRKLEKSVADAPESAPAQFLLGYHYLMTGAKAEAKAHFALAAKLTPNDKLAQHILDQMESNSAITPPTLPAQPDDPKGKLL